MMKGIFFLLIKGIYEKHADNIILNDEGLDVFLQDHEQEYMCAKASSMEHCTGASSPGN